MPPAPPGLKWFDYCLYPLPFKTDPEKEMVYKPQHILVPKNFNWNSRNPKFAPVYIAPKNYAPYTPINKIPLKRYMMPILHRPIDPELADKLKARNTLVNSIKKRKTKNLKLNKPGYKPDPACESHDKICWNRLRQRQTANRQAKLNLIKSKCKGNKICE